MISDIPDYGQGAVAVLANIAIMTIDSNLFTADSSSHATGGMGQHEPVIVTGASHFKSCGFIAGGSHLFQVSNGTGTGERFDKGGFDLGAAGVFNTGAGPRRFYFGGEILGTGPAQGHRMVAV